MVQLCVDGNGVVHLGWCTWLAFWHFYKMWAHLIDEGDLCAVCCVCFAAPSAAQLVHWSEPNLFLKLHQDVESRCMGTKQQGTTMDREREGERLGMVDWFLWGVPQLVPPLCGHFVTETTILSRPFLRPTCVFVQSYALRAPCTHSTQRPNGHTVGAR